MFRSPPGSNRPYEPNRDPRPAATSSSGGFSSFFSSFFGSSFGAPPRDGPPPSFARVASSTASGARAAMASAWACAFARRSFTLSRVGNPDSTASAIAGRYAFERGGRDGPGYSVPRFHEELVLLDHDLPALDRRRDSRFLELADDRPGLERGLTLVDPQVLWRDLPAARGSFRLRSLHLAEQPEWVQARRHDRGLAIDDVHKLVQSGFFRRGFPKGDPEEVVLRDDDSRLPVELPSHRLELRRGDSLDPHNPDDRRCLEVLDEGLDQIDFIGSNVRHQTTSDVPHRGAHRRLDEGRPDVEPPALELAENTAHEEVEVLREVLRRHVPRADGCVERPLVAGADAHRVSERDDHGSGVRARREGLRHLPPRAEDDAEPLADHGHQGGLRDEEVEQLGGLLFLVLVPRERLALLGLDDEIGGALCLEGHLPRGEDAHPDLSPAALREDDLLVDPVLRDGQVDVP